MIDSLPQHSRPFWLAALITTIAVPLGYGLVAMGLLLASGEMLEDDFLVIGGAVLVFAIPICAVGVYLAGLPLVTLLRARRWLYAPVVCVVASIAGAFVLTIILTLDSAFKSVQPLLGGALGFAAGLVFSLAAGISWWPRRS